MLEELGPSHLPVPNSFPQSKENPEFNYSFLITTTDREPGTQADQAWTTGAAPDGKGEFNVKLAEPMGYVPDLGFGRADTFGQKKGKDIASKLMHPNA